MSERGNLARRIGLVGVVLALSIGLWVAVRGGARDDSSLAEDVDAPTAHLGKAVLARAESAGTAAPGFAVSASLPGDVLPPASASDPFDANVRRIVDLRFKGLLRTEELDERRALLSDPRLLERAARELIRPKDLPPREDQLRRINLVTFLVEAIAWHDNPHLELAVAKAKQVVLSENYHLESSQWFRRSLAGDKVDLLAGMAEHQPAAVAALADAARAGRNAKLVAFALRHIGIVGPADGQERQVPEAVSQ